METHLLDFDGDIYGQGLDLIFTARLRGEMRFPGVEALVTQIKLDIEKAREVLTDSK